MTRPPKSLYRDNPTSPGLGTSGFIEFTKTIGHENGHTLSWTLSRTEGGWGPDLVWSKVWDKDPSTDPGWLFPDAIQSGVVQNGISSSIRGWYDHRSNGICNRMENFFSEHYKKYINENWSIGGPHW